MPVSERTWGFESPLSHVSDYSQELSFAIELARLGGAIAMSHYGRDPRTERKPDGTWVTEADRAAEAQIRLRLARAYPEHNILGEEEGLTAAGGGEPIPDAPTWIIDPIDGTNNYMTGIPIWATLVGLQIDDRSVVGVAYAPALGETYDGGVGLGARVNGTEIKAAEVADLKEAVFLHGDVQSFLKRGHSDFINTITSKVWRSRGFGDFWGHMLVARGAAHIMAEPEVSAWDIAPLLPIIEEAGGRLTHFDGSEWSGEGSALTTCGPIHDEVVALAS